MYYIYIKKKKMGSEESEPQGPCYARKQSQLRKKTKSVIKLRERIV